MKVSSMDFFLDASPVRWKGPMDVSPVWLGLMEMNVIREFLADVVWGELDICSSISLLGLRRTSRRSSPGLFRTWRERLSSRRHQKWRRMWCRSRSPMPVT